MKLSLIIVNYNCDKWLKNLFNSINLQIFEHEVIIIDNNSPQLKWIDDIKILKTPPKIIKLEKNIGFGGACNIGAINSSGEILFFLNPDINFSDSQIFARIYEVINQGHLDVVSPLILDIDGIDPFYGKKLSIDAYGYVGLSNEFPFYIEGSALAISRKNFFKVGMFDDDYFMYSEDIDLSWRARLIGLKIGIINDIQVNHFSGGSNIKSIAVPGKRYSTPITRRYEVEKNNISNLLKLYSAISLLIIMPSYVILSFLEIATYAILNEKRVILAILSAWLWNIKNFKKTLLKRKVIQDLRTQGDLTIFLSTTGLFPNKIKALVRVGAPKFVD